MYMIFKEARDARRWDAERNCYMDKEGIPVVDPKTIDFEALIASIPTVDKLYRPRKRRRIVKKHVEEIINVN
ncbi:hypothetical protein Hanom_Chr05g00414141 [Helianthus anomalus]